ncbi:ATPase, T2SS/T4P/T4SS family [Paenibacillus sp. GCM10012307]|uniref:Flp pilus assembly complex ATPase component TadA n=1 Tax=Paenibacillus roseus TaxID=2798579 RepID=A0A934IWB2_9BACL|nr:ATPase, T2SS/T4P/T4SS family [Paenibacillus roseus]MBJ6360497.1 Flp pilus assembly complex ATPase component TadA [Paenibacillus roseus]
MYSLKNKVLFRGNRSEDFFSYVEKFRERFQKQIESDEQLLDLAQRALVGESTAVMTATKEIERQMREYPYSGRLPEAYQGMDVTSAIFQEWLGFSVAAPWLYDRQHMYSQKMQIIGKNISLAYRGEYHPYPHQFVSADRVDQLRRTLITHNPRVKLNQSHPSAEFKINDPLWPGRFIRIAVWISPRVWEGFTTITFRRQTVENMSLDDQAGSGLIGEEAIPLFRNLIACYPNLVVSGPVESGKTTKGNTLVLEQLLQAEFSLGVILIETHPESTLPLAPIADKHRIIPIIASSEELMDVGIQSLRHDPDLIYMSEMRWSEWLFYNFAGEKGYRGLLGTYHTKESEDIPYQAAHAVYSQSGGNLKGHLMATLKSVEIVAVLEPQRYGKKKLMRLSEIRYDPNAKIQVVANDLVRYDDQMKKWFYNSDLSAALKARLSRVNPGCAKELFGIMERLAQQAPIEDPIVPSMKCQVVLEGND